MCTISKDFFHGAGNHWHFKSRQLYTAHQQLKSIIGNAAAHKWCKATSTLRQIVPTGNQLSYSQRSRRRHCTLYTVQALGVQPFHLAPRLLQAARRDKNALTSGALVAKLLVLGPGPFGFFQGSATLCFMVITGGVGAGTGAGILS